MFAEDPEITWPGHGRFRVIDFEEVIGLVRTMNLCSVEQDIALGSLEASKGQVELAVEFGDVCELERR
jgi:hypothetical protein